MRINKKDKIADIPVVKLRDYFARVDTDYIERVRVKDYFNLNADEADILLRELVERGFVEEEKDHAGKYGITMQENAFSIARCVSPLNKEKADRLLKEFMERVEEVNRDDQYLFRVNKVLLFGSYINSTSVDYGDIDIAIELEAKISDRESFIEACQAQSREAARNGRSFSNFLERLAYPEVKVVRKLKNRCMYLSIHNVNDGILEQAECKQVYP